MEAAPNQREPESEGKRGRGAKKSRVSVGYLPTIGLTGASTARFCPTSNPSRIITSRHRLTETGTAPEPIASWGHWNIGQQHRLPWQCRAGPTMPYTVASTIPANAVSRLRRVGGVRNQDALLFQFQLVNLAGDHSTSTPDSVCPFRPPLVRGHSSGAPCASLLKADLRFSLSRSQVGHGGPTRAHCVFSSAPTGSSAALQLACCLPAATISDSPLSPNRITIYLCNVIHSRS